MQTIDIVFKLVNMAHDEFIRVKVRRSTLLTFGLVSSLPICNILDCLQDKMWCRENLSRCTLRYKMNLRLHIEQAKYSNVCDRICICPVVT